MARRSWWSISEKMEFKKKFIYACLVKAKEEIFETIHIWSSFGLKPLTSYWLESRDAHWVNVMEDKSSFVLFSPHIFRYANHQICTSSLAVSLNLIPEVEETFLTLIIFAQCTFDHCHDLIFLFRLINIRLWTRAYVVTSCLLHWNPSFKNTLRNLPCATNFDVMAWVDPSPPGDLYFCMSLVSSSLWRRPTLGFDSLVCLFVGIFSFHF